MGEKTARGARRAGSSGPRDAAYRVARFEIPGALLDLFAGALWEAGTLGFEYDDATGESVIVRAYFPHATAPASVVERLIPWLRASGGPDLTATSWHTLDAVDWNAVWRSSYAPIEIGARLVIAPSWSRRRFAGRQVVKIRPEMAFGTGSHETTRLCLEALQESVRPGMRVGDVGTGSGILAIAAVRLGAGRVDACDPDPVALDNARYNARLNRVSDAVRLYAGDVNALPTDAAYDCVVANIVLEPLREALPGMARRLRAGGILHLSGLLAGQEEGLLSPARDWGLKPVERKEAGGWLVLTLIRT